MKIKLITFATPNFYVSRYTLLDSAKKFGLDNNSGFNLNDFKRTNFYKQHSGITTQKRGAGYWLWKPYYIYQELQKLNEGDILIYCDSGVDIVASLQPLIDIVATNKTGILLFENYQGSQYYPRTTGLEVNEYNLYVEVNKNKYWAKRDTFVLMGLDSDTYWNSPQVDANIHLYRKNSTSLAFVKEWLDYCCEEQILTDAPNSCGKPDFPNLFGHIHDQAIISLLAQKHKIELHRSASQFSNHYKLLLHRVKDEFLVLPYSNSPKMNSDYGTLFNHHRGRVMPFLFRFKSYLKGEFEVIRSYL